MHGNGAGFLRRNNFELHIFLQFHVFAPRRVLEARAFSFSSGEFQRDGLVRAHFAAVVIEQNVAGLHMQLTFLRVAFCIMQIDLHHALAANASGVRLVAAFARTHGIVAITSWTVNSDLNIFEEAAILVLELRRLRCMHGEECSRADHSRNGEARGLLRDRRGNRRESFAARSVARADVQVNAEDQQTNGNSNAGGPTRVAGRFAVAHSFVLA